MTIQFAVVPTLGKDTHCNNWGRLQSKILFLRSYIFSVLLLFFFSLPLSSTRFPNLLLFRTGVYPNSYFPIITVRVNNFPSEPLIILRFSESLSLLNNCFAIILTNLILNPNYYGFETRSIRAVNDTHVMWYQYNNTKGKKKEKKRSLGILCFRRTKDGSTSLLYFFSYVFI